MNKTKIILDTDIGDDIDDALAVAFALRCEEIELLGITTVYKNTKLRSAIAKKILQIAGREHIEVFYGEENPFIEKINPFEVPCQYTDESEIGEKDAVSFMISTILASDKDEITLVAIGPLTNLAHVILREPKVKDMLKEIVMMAGAYYVHCNECNMILWQYLRSLTIRVFNIAMKTFSLNLQGNIQEVQHPLRILHGGQRQHRMSMLLKV